MSERLTRKMITDPNEYICKECKQNENRLDCSYCKSMDNVFNKLGQIENIMEQFQIPSVEQLHDALCCGEEFEKEIKTLTARWEKLKSVLHDQYKIDDKEYDKTGVATFAHYIAFNNWVLDKMQELEKESEDV